MKAEYVGDEACASCHEAIYARFHETGMGRSVTLFDPARAVESFEQTQFPVFDERRSFYYEAFVRHDTLFQREYRKDKEGHIIHERVYPVAYVIGSGHATRSYLMDVNGFITEMPLTWYVHRKKWDLSPGYRLANDRFERKINLECMTCHNGIPDYTPFTQNHYRRIPLGITCERCHGPGSVHVEERLAGMELPEGVRDTTIVNPASLSRARQLDVCQQCHLTGISVFSEGNNPTTFRPGMPLAAHRRVFVPRKWVESPEEFGIASQALRLAQSACFKASTMTCTTCHDPHRSVEKVSEQFYDTVCQQCHTQAQEQHRGIVSGEAWGEQTCVSCHMGRSQTSDVPHVTFTDHWIRRRVPAPTHQAGEPVIRDREPLELVRVEETKVEGATEGGGYLMAAAAYFDFYETMHRLPDYLPRVVQYARKGLAAGERHLEGWIALGRALAAMDSLARAEEVFEAIVQAYPEEAWPYFWLGAVRDEAGRPQEARELLEKAVQIQPLFMEAQEKLADVRFRTGDIAGAIATLVFITRQDPEHHPRAWYNLGLLYLKQRQVEEALHAFQQAARLNPDLVDAQIQAGSIYFAQGRLQEAESWFRRAIANRPDAPQAYGSLALVYIRQGKLAEARKYLKKVLELDPQNPYARQLLRQMESGGL